MSELMSEGQEISVTKPNDIVLLRPACYRTAVARYYKKVEQTMSDSEAKDCLASMIQLEDCVVHRPFRRIGEGINRRDFMNT
jgi:hypothetical protein